MNIDTLSLECPLCGGEVRYDRDAKLYKCYGIDTDRFRRMGRRSPPGTVAQQFGCRWESVPNPDMPIFVMDR